MGRGGFTLIELLLALGLVLLLAGMFSFNYVVWERRGKLEEALRQFEAVLRLAKAESATTGKKLRLEFGPEGSFKVTWEPQPLTEPGAFQDYTVATWSRELPCELLAVRSCRLTDTSLLTSPEVSQTGPEGAVLSPISFYPDGSSDSAVIEAGGKMDDETRIAVIELDGLNGIITTRLLLLSEFEEYQKNNAQP